jgi:hypothetical protein
MSGNSWQTPDWLLRLVRLIAVIMFDPCTVASNPTGAVEFRTIDDDPDGLTTDWLDASGGGLTFANIPFGRGAVALWIDKVIEEVTRGVELVLVVRGDTSTRWARRLIQEGHPPVICLPPRIRFRDSRGSPNFSNLIFYFGQRPEAFARAFGDLGPLLGPLSEFNSSRVSAATRDEQSTSGVE